MMSISKAYVTMAFCLINSTQQFAIFGHGFHVAPCRTDRKFLPASGEGQRHCWSLSSFNLFVQANGDDENERSSLSLTVPSVHLISIPALEDSAPQCVRDVWRWKDVALGDGRDFFVPRPRAIRDLQSLFLRQESVLECAVLSNCARLDVYVVVDNDDAVRSVAARVLTTQTRSWRDNRRSVFVEDLASRFDLPGVVDTISPIISDDIEDDDVRELADRLERTSNLTDVVRHSCLVAAGMKVRPSRPGRAIPFRPFSSRDAHVMLQLKRTVEVAQGPRVRRILEAALRAGKAARDPNKVPEIEPLRAYNSGEGGRYAKPDPPVELVERATRAAVRSAVDPAIVACLGEFVAADATERVTALRARVHEIVDGTQSSLLSTKEERTRLVNRMLHQPTMDLRKGRPVDEDSLIREIVRELATTTKVGK